MSYITALSLDRLADIIVVSQAVNEVRGKEEFNTDANDVEYSKNGKPSNQLLDVRDLSLLEQLAAHEKPEDEEDALDDVDQFHEETEFLVFVQRLLAELDFDCVHLERNVAGEGRRGHDGVNNRQEQVDYAQKNHPREVEPHDHLVQPRDLGLQRQVFFLALENADALDVLVRQDV